MRVSGECGSSWGTVSSRVNLRTVRLWMVVEVPAQLGIWSDKGCQYALVKISETRRENVLQTPNLTNLHVKIVLNDSGFSFNLLY